MQPEEMKMHQRQSKAKHNTGDSHRHFNVKMTAQTESEGVVMEIKVASNELPYFLKSICGSFEIEII